MSRLLNIDLSYINPQSPQFARFKAWGEQSLSGNTPYGYTATHAVKLFIGTGDKRWKLDAIAKIDEKIIKALADISSGVNPGAAFDSYLYAGGLLQDMSMVLAFCADVMTPEQIDSIKTYGPQILFNIWNPDNAKWGDRAAPWTGWGTKDPSSNYHHAFLLGTMYGGFAEIDDFIDWIEYTLTNLIQPLVDYYKVHGIGGGSGEGTGYGVSHARLFHLYDLWLACTGQNLADQSTHVHDTADYLVHYIVPTLDRYAPIGDLSRDSSSKIYDYHRGLMLQTRKTVSSQMQKDKLTWLLKRISLQQMKDGFNFDGDLLPVGETELAPTALYHHASAIGDIFARSDWTTKASWFCMKAGNYTQNHAHQDQGGFILFRDDYLVVPANIFSKSDNNPNAGLNQAPRFQNTLRFLQNGLDISQGYGNSEVTVTPGDNGKLTVVADLTPYYAQVMWRAPKGIAKWQRTATFENHTLRVRDEFATVATVFNKVPSPAPIAIFQAQVKEGPVMEGSKIRAGNLLITVISPANPVIKFVDYAAEFPSAFIGGHRVDISGGTTEYEVLYETFPAVPVDPIPDPEEPPVVDPAIPVWPANVTHVLTTDAKYDRQSWHYQGIPLWKRKGEVLITDCVATSPLSTGGSGTTTRMWKLLSTVLPDDYVRMATATPSSLTNKNVANMIHVKLTFPPAEPIEDPEMIKELQDQIAVLNLTVEQQNATIQENEAEIADLSSRISFINFTIDELHVDIAEYKRILAQQAAALEAQGPMIEKLNRITSALKEAVQ